MKLEQLLLQKHEIPIIRRTFFKIPIHPHLLRKDIQLDPELAKKVFPQTAAEWYQDFRKHTEEEQDPKEKEWYKRVFLKHEPRIIKRRWNQTMKPCSWEDNTHYEENGFVSGMSISRNAGGTLFYNPDDRACIEHLSRYDVKFSPEKFKAYAAEGIEQIEGVSGIIAHSYDRHNIDHPPGAYFLRNWAILYLNEAMKSIKETFT